MNEIIPESIIIGSSLFVINLLVTLYFMLRRSIINFLIKQILVKNGYSKFFYVLPSVKCGSRHEAKSFCKVGFSNDLDKLFDEKKKYAFRIIYSFLSLTTIMVFFAYEAVN